jgi:hypothetical protein
MNTDDKVRLLVDGGNHGIYAWQHFVTAYDPTEWHVQVLDLRTLEAGPDDENYWEAAANVEMEAEFHDGKHTWYLVQYEGDIFARRADLTVAEYREAFP